MQRNNDMKLMLSTSRKLVRYITNSGIPNSEAISMVSKALKERKYLVDQGLYAMVTEQLETLFNKYK
tara:strand:+ start:487 stop:687 length:201 start_codon:yes stop_codon:yes gene_type:complete